MVTFGATEPGLGEDASPSSWPELPPELLGLVLQRLPSLTDRVRLAASCRSWRSGVRLQAPLPAPAPWLILGDRAYLDLGNGAVQSLSVPAAAGGDCCCRGSIGEWLFFTHDVDGGDCSLVNPFSGAELSLQDLASFFPEIQHTSSYSYLAYNTNPKPKVIQKVVAMAAPLSSSSTPVVATLITNDSFYDNDAMFVCRAGAPPDRSPATPEHSPRWFLTSMELWLAQDIEFFHGKLYVLSLGEQLAVVTVEACRGRPGFTGDKRTVISCRLNARNHEWWNTARYLVDSGDRLLMVKRLTDAAGRTYKFEVFEADLGDDDDPGRWNEAGSLRGRALFVSKHGSKSVPVDQYCGVVQEDCIYFIHEDDVQDRYERRPGDPLADSGVYNLRDKTVAPFRAPETTVPRRTWGPWMPTWLFPTQVW